MFRWLDLFLIRLSGWQIALCCAVLVIFFGAMDGLTAREVSFAIFYLVPISVAAWYGSRTLTYGIVVLATAMWFTVDYTANAAYGQPWILSWNSMVRLVLFAAVAFLIRELRSHLQLQEKLARTDTLTGLLNRTGFMERSEALVNSASRYGLSLAIGYIDLDGFKKINDTLGHFHGDEVLKAIGTTLGESSRESDIAGRIGGDEFAVLLPNTSLAGAGIFFEKLHVQLLSDIKQNGWSELGVSIGAIVFENGPPALGDALKYADHLMYRAKKSTRTSVLVEAPAEMFSAPRDNAAPGA